MKQENSPVTIKNVSFGFAGAILGGVLGYAAFAFLVDQGLYSLIIPGACVGLGFGLATGRRHVVFGIISGVIGLIVCIGCEWQVINKGGTLNEFWEGFKKAGIGTWAMLAIGVLVAYWFGLGRETRGLRRKIRLARKDKGGSNKDTP